MFKLFRPNTEPKKTDPTTDTRGTTRNRRTSERILIHFNSLIAIDIAGKSVGFIKNISYGGALITLNKPLDIKNSKILITLKIFGATQDFHTQIRRNSKESLGVSFDFPEQSALTFLWKLIENFKRGQSLSSIPSHMLKESFQAGFFHYFRGDGPTDLKFSGTKLENLDLLLTFPLAERYAAISLRNSSLTTEKTAAGIGPAAQMKPDSKPDPELIMKGLCILSSCAAIKKHPVLHEFIERISIASFGQL